MFEKFGFRRKSSRERAVDGHRARVLKAVQEDAHNAGIFADFIVEALNRGYAMRIMVEVDGIECKSGLLFPGGDFVEYMANWACAQKIVKGIKARKFEMQVGEQELPDLRTSSDGVGNVSPEI